MLSRFRKSMTVNKVWQQPERSPSPQMDLFSSFAYRCSVRRCVTVETVVNSKRGSGAVGEWMRPGYQGAAASPRSIKFSAAGLKLGSHLGCRRTSLKGDGVWLVPVRSDMKTASSSSSKQLSGGVAALIAERQRQGLTGNAPSRRWRWLGGLHKLADGG